MALNFANNNSLSAITSLPASISGGGMTLIQEQTASSSSTISFTSGIDSTYDEYVFKLYNIHPSSDSDVQLQFNGSVDTGSNYNVTKTTTHFSAYHYESDAYTGLGYNTAYDLAQSTAFQVISTNIGGDNDQCGSGYIHLFNPSSATFVKNFISNVSFVQSDDVARIDYVAGYFNTQSVLDSIQFKFSSGNIDSGVIKLYGIS